MALIKKVSIKDIAEKAGVSTTLVSFVLNGKAKAYRVNEKTAKKIMDIANQLSYKPNQTAQRLRGGKSHIIGVVVSGISNPFFSSIARVFEDMSAAYGYNVFFGSSDERADTMQKVIYNLISHEVDGLVVVPCEETESFLQALVNQKVPIVLLDRFFPDTNICHVGLDNEKATYDATKYLLADGYKKPAIIAYDIALNHMTNRIKGYRSAMEENGKEDSISVYYLDTRKPYESAEDVIKEAISNKVDSFVFATNIISLSCLYHLKKLSKQDINKIGLVGFDGNPVFDFFEKPIPYIEQPIEELVKRAFDNLVKIISGKEAESAVLDGKLIVKEYI